MITRPLQFTENDTANAAFPERRLARVQITLNNGTNLQSGWHEPRWDAATPPSNAEIENKFRTLCTPVIGKTRTRHLKDTILTLDQRPLADLLQQISRPI